MTKAKIFRADVVEELIGFYGKILTDRSIYPTIYDHILSLSAKMWEGVQSQIPCVKVEINNYHPDYLGEPLDSSRWQEFTQEECRIAIAHQYGYDGWEEVETQSKIPYDHMFQDAVDLLLAGDLENLTEMVTNNPRVLDEKSQYGHHASLIHYCGSNGVEMWRQQVPLNLIKIVEFLISNGIDVNAQMSIYGRWHTTVQLAATSIHPQEAGILRALISALS